MRGNHAFERAATGAKRHKDVAQREDKQTKSHRDSIAAFLHQRATDEEGAGDVGTVIPGGKNGRLLSADAHGYLDVVVHDVEEAVGKTPHEEKADRGDGDGGVCLSFTEVLSASRLTPLDIEVLDALDEGGEELGSHREWTEGR